MMKIAWEDVRHRLGGAVQTVRQVLYGMTRYEWAQSARRERAEVERLFVLVSFGDLVGLPILPPYYTLRLLPYVVPAIQGWKRSLLRERDWSDLTEFVEGID